MIHFFTHLISETEKEKRVPQDCWYSCQPSTAIARIKMILLSSVVQTSVLFTKKLFPRFKTMCFCYVLCFGKSLTYSGLIQTVFSYWRIFIISLDGGKEEAEKSWASQFQTGCLAVGKLVDQLMRTTTTYLPVIRPFATIMLPCLSYFVNNNNNNNSERFLGCRILSLWLNPAVLNMFLKKENSWKTSYIYETPTKRRIGFLCLNLEFSRIPTSLLP